MNNFFYKFLSLLFLLIVAFHYKSTAQVTGGGANNSSPIQLPNIVHAWPLADGGGGGGGGINNPPPIQLPNIIQASPEASALGRYGDQNIGLNTGTPMVNIPLYQLKTKTLSLPISLSYSSNGIKVDELATRVGMSWVLNAGGVITTTVYDKPDFEANKSPAPPSLNFHPYNSSMNSTYSSLFTSDPNLVTWMENSQINLFDMQKDEYNFNFNGYTGKFIFDDNGLPVLLPLSDLKIEFNSQNTAWNFKVTMPDGTKYYFGGPAVDITLAVTGLSNHDQYISSWYLNRIESASDPSDFITLNYGQTLYGYYSGVSENVTIDPNNPPGTSYGLQRPFGGSSEAGANLPGLGLPVFNKQNIGINGVYIQSINASHYGTIKFSYQNKPDINSGQDYMLQNMEVDLSSGTSNLNFAFNYDIVPPNAYRNGVSNYYTSDSFALVQNLPRPFLTSVVQTAFGVTGVSKSYSFQYINNYNLPHHLAFCQDHWGYYNGKSNLNSIIFPGDNDYALLGGTMVNSLMVNRDVDYNFAQNGLLSKITYPTGGSTQFTYEGNSVNGVSPVAPSPGDPGSPAQPVFVNSINTSSSASFWITAPTTVYLTMNISCNCPNGGCTQLADNTPAGQLVLNNLTNIVTLDFTPFNERGDCSRSSGGSYVLQPGGYGFGAIPHSPYLITMTLSTADGSATLQTNLPPSATTPVLPTFAPLDGTFYGGLRIKTTTDTDPLTGITNVKNYTYNGLSGSYLPLYELPIYKYGLGAKSFSDPITTQYSATTFPSYPFDYAVYDQFLSGTFSNLVGRNSHNVSYTSVTESYGNNFEGGGVDHTYSYNINNSALIHNYGGHVVLNPSPPEFFWRNGLETIRSEYRMVDGSKVPVQTTNRIYVIDPRINNNYEQFVLKDNGGSYITACYTDIAYILDGTQYPVGCNPAFFSDAFAFNKRESVFDVYSITNKQEWQYLAQTQTTNYDLNGQNPLISTVNYYYDNPTHLQLSRTVLTNSDKKILTTSTTYPDDYATGTSFIDDMVTNHLTGFPIETTNYETIDGNNFILSGKVTEYWPGGNGLINNISSIESGIRIPQLNFKFANSPLGQLPGQAPVLNYSRDQTYKSRMSYYYNTAGDPLQVNLTHGPSTSYQWGYNNQYPVAEAKNAASNDIFFDSFEEGDGNSLVNDCKTGHFSYDGSTTSYSKGLNKLDPGTYTLSYWLRSAKGIWSLVINTSVPVTGTTYTITIGGQIDDVRFYPSAAQMTTYTYDPLVGITSMTDAKSDITYYEYDSFQRLINIKDHLGNIVKSFCYNYAGQTTGCTLPAAPPTQPQVFQSDPESAPFTRSNCAANSTGTTVTYSLPAGAFTSRVSIGDADQQALAYLKANGPAYANSNGSCTSNAAPNVLINLNNTTNSGYSVSFTNSTSNITLTFNNNGIVLPTPTVPAGTYYINVYPTDSGPEVPHTFELTGVPDQTGTPRASYTGYVVAPGPLITLLVY